VASRREMRYESRGRTGLARSELLVGMVAFDTLESGVGNVSSNRSSWGASIEGISTINLVTFNTSSRDESPELSSTSLSSLPSLPPSKRSRASTSSTVASSDETRTLSLPPFPLTNSGPEILLTVTSSSSPAKFITCTASEVSSTVSSSEPSPRLKIRTSTSL